MRPEILHLLEIARSQQWRLWCGSEAYPFISSGSEGCFPRILPRTVRFNNWDTVVFNDEEVLAVERLTREIEVREQSYKDRSGWETLLRYLKNNS